MKKIISYLSVFFTCLVFTQQVSAQLNPLGSMYYQNQYLGNPAFAGIEEGLNVNAIYRKQFNDVPGSPVTQSLTGDYGFGNRAAVGLNLNFAKTGLINFTRMMVTYAYHLPLNENDKLSFGLSLGVNKAYINSRELSGDGNDPVISRFDDRGSDLDGDFGMAYRGKKLTLQGAVINLRNYLKTDPNAVDGINYATFFLAGSYKINLNNDLDAEPKLAYRGINGFDDILDAGVNLSFKEQFNIYGLYHSTENATFGFGVRYNNLLTFNGMYTTNTADTKGYTNGDFEIGLSLKLQKKTNK